MSNAISGKQTYAFREAVRSRFPSKTKYFKVSIAYSLGTSIT